MRKNLLVFTLLSITVIGCSLNSTDESTGTVSSLPAIHVESEVIELLNSNNQALLSESEWQNQSIPADAEYVIFMLDTSGSMFSNPSWNRTLQTISAVFKLYPDLAGMQVINDMGDYMLSRYSGGWIPNTSEQRELVLESLNTWNAYSNSSPIEGLNEVFSNLTGVEGNVSIYVFGDDLNSANRSNEELLAEINRLNTNPDTGSKLTRIHSVTFATILIGPEQFRDSADNYVALMSSVAKENGGTFQLLNYQ